MKISKKQIIQILKDHKIIASIRFHSNILGTGFIINCKNKEEDYIMACNLFKKYSNIFAVSYR